MLTNILKFSSLFIISSIFFASCEKEENGSEFASEGLQETSAQVSKPIHFSDKEDLVSAFYNYSETENLQSRASDDNFVSYLETVMSQDGYDDQPYAILSDAFGAILNSEGEVCFGDNMIHVSDKGILYGPISDSASLRSLANNPNLLEHCTEHGYYAPLADSTFYRVNGYPNIYMYDTFHFLIEEDYSLETRSGIPINQPIIYDSDLNTIEENSISLGFRKLRNPNPDLDTYDWNHTFKRPHPGDQKVKFSDGRHCNDTKIFQQNYGGFLKDSGIKTKTMKKRKLGYWDKVDGDMLAGIRFLSVYEKINPENKNHRYPYGVSTVHFGGSEKKVFNLPTNHDIGHILTNINSSGAQRIIEQLKKDKGVSVDAIRLIVNATESVTLFPDRLEAKHTKKIEMNFTVPFGGESYGDTYVAEFRVLTVLMFGQTTRGDEIRGSALAYSFYEVK